MNIYDYYLERNKDEKWVDNFRSTADENCGKTFMYINTNYRSLYAFIDTFSKFEVYNGVDRSKWDLHPNHKQEKAKQWVVRMRQSKLFRQNGNIYTLTAKGMAFSDFMATNMNYSEQWYLTYLFILTSYFNLTPNYVSNKTRLVFNALNESGYISEYLLDLQNRFLLEKEYTMESLFSSELFWLISFYQDKDFINVFQKSTPVEKKALYGYVCKNYENKVYADCISYKFKPSGQYSKNTFIDDVKTLYFTFIGEQIKCDITKYYYYSLTDVYCKIFKDTNKNKVLEFIATHQDVFDIILREYYGTIEEDLISKYEYKPRPLQEAQIGIKLDPTTTKDSDNMDYVSSILKRMAKERSDYKCALCDLNDCRYFTSRENNKNYLEIHHLIPREFSNEFENSIEILDNYVPLCPNCHRLLHNATDRERLSSLTYVYNRRKESLHNNKLEIDLDLIKQFYGIVNK